MRTFKLLTLGMLSAGVASAPASSVDDFRWMSGHWCAAAGAEQIEEHWLMPGGDLMLGLSRTIKAGKTQSFEFLRIEFRQDGAHYVAQPGGVPPTAFRLTAAGPGWARFENPEHDFPTRVEYRRTASGLHAEISGPGEGGKQMIIPFEYHACESR